MGERTWHATHVTVVAPPRRRRPGERENELTTLGGPLGASERTKGSRGLVRFFGGFAVTGNENALVARAPLVLGRIMLLPPARLWCLGASRGSVVDRGKPQQNESHAMGHREGTAACAGECSPFTRPEGDRLRVGKGVGAGVGAREGRARCGARVRGLTLTETN